MQPFESIDMRDVALSQPGKDPVDTNSGTDHPVVIGTIYQAAVN
jgi:hypothetical protein